jgi:predicted acylesterase/phospholipase RssA
MKKLLWGGIVLVVIVGALALWAQRALQIPERLAAVPEAMTMRAIVPGIPNARYWVGIEIDTFARDVLAARERELAFRASTGQTGELPPADLLALSGGGDKGAFGSGLLNGWTASGTRPTFKAVTGISTGALIAPFAFLGPDYDDVLKEVFTTIGPEDILTPRGVLAVIENDGMADNQPLWGLISKHVDEALLDAIAEQHANGRSLLIATTDLDARQPVIWNMGNIAESDAPGALNLFRSILLASAAIPGAFPPAMIRVEVDGVPYDEMHVDGGASAQVFLYPPSLAVAMRTLGAEVNRTGRVYVIRNSWLESTWDPPNRRTIDIAGRAISSLIQTQGFGDLYRIYLTAQRDGFDFNLAFIGSEFQYPLHEQFDTEFMNALYDYGYKLALEGYPWKKLPPGLESAPLAFEEAAATPPAPEPALEVPSAATEAPR